MKIKKVLNNNVVIAQNDNEETILMGLGLGFGKKAGEVVEDKKIEKIFEKHPIIYPLPVGTSEGTCFYSGYETPFKY